MARISGRIRIAAPVERVFDTAADSRNEPSFNPIACVARPGQQVVAGDRLADRIGIGVLAMVFPPELVDRVVDEAGVREQRTRTLRAGGGVLPAGDGAVLQLQLHGGVEQAGRGPGLGAAVPGADAAGDAADGGGGDLRPPAAGLAGDGGPDGGGCRAAGRAGAGTRVRVRDAAGRGGRDVPGPAGH